MKSGPRWEQLGSKKKEISKTRSRENFLFMRCRKVLIMEGLYNFLDIHPLLIGMCLKLVHA